jgi:ACR3 family arsenite efflux pump ArsB
MSAQNSTGSKGQAIVEVALVTPILLAFLLAIAWVGMALLMAYQLTHAAAEGAISGAANAGDSCGVAVVDARQVYGMPLNAAACSVIGQVLEVRLTDTLTFPIPFEITRAERAVLR